LQNTRRNGVFRAENVGRYKRKDLL
jgi:hypothetical protein